MAQPGYDWLEDAAIWCSAVVLLCLLAWLVFTWYRGDAALGPPRDLCCPMSLELFTDPVVAADGETYERLGKIARAAAAGKWD